MNLDKLIRYVMFATAVIGLAERINHNVPVVRSYIKKRKPTPFGFKL